MKTMGAGAFKAQCLAIMDEVQAKRESVVITKHGKPVAKLVPADSDADEIYNFLRGKGAVMGDVISPAIEDWGNLKCLAEGIPLLTADPQIRRSRALTTIW
ncbi:MAG TPA: type II toxin-antitoxin system Phd/YefM family antitoxin [Terriglobia bacterium]|nr:type II toxin-antitoxin system Phd/YefM family antitoxin [Terriglobia bacterium]